MKITLDEETMFIIKFIIFLIIFILIMLFLHIFSPESLSFPEGRSLKIFAGGV